MRSSISAISAVCILWSFFQTAVSAIELEPGYDCDDSAMGPTFIPEKRLTEILEEAKLAARFRILPATASRKRLSYLYYGPPFGELYLLWPVSPTTKNYKKAAQTPFRAVIDQNTFQVISVISKYYGESVRECILREKLTMESSRNDLDCEPGYILNKNLMLAASTACPKIRELRQAQGGFYPARYFGPPYKDSGKQLYIFPVKADVASDVRKGFPNEFVVINTGCKIVGAVKGVDIGTSKARYFQCKDIGISIEDRFGAAESQNPDNLSRRLPSKGKLS